MRRTRFSIATRFRWNDTPFEVRRLLPNGQIVAANVLTGEELRPIPQSELVEALFAGKIVFEITGNHTVKSNDGVVSTKRTHTLLAHFRLVDVVTACYRLWAIRPLLKVNRTNRHYEQRIEEIKSFLQDPLSIPEQELIREIGLDVPIETLYKIRRTISVGSLKRWVGDYFRGNQNFESLIPNYEHCGAPGKSRLEAELNRLIELVIDQVYMRRESYTIDDVVQELAVVLTDINQTLENQDRLPTPHRSTVARRIRARPEAPFIAIKHGKRAAELSQRQYGSYEYPDEPLALVEYDDTTMDLIVLDRNDLLPLGRTTIGWLRDTCTMYPLGYCSTFEWPSSLTAMETLYHGILPKLDVQSKYGTANPWIAHGHIERLVVDNAKYLRNPSFRQICFDLGTTLIPARVKDPTFKAGIESHMNTMNKMLFHKIPGTTFSNPQKRGDYDSSETACVFADEIDKATTIFITDIYAQSEHRDLGFIPAREWEKATQKAGYLWPLPPDAERLRMLLGRMIHRTLFHYGIELFSLAYNSPKLGKIRSRLQDKEKIMVKFQPNDISKIYVYDRFEDNYIEVPIASKYEEYAKDLSLWKHQVIRKAALETREQVDLVALGRAKRKIQEIIQAGPKSSLKTRRRAARWHSNGNPTRMITGGVIPHTTGAEEAPPESRNELPAVPPKLPPQLPAINLDDSSEGWGIVSVPKHINAAEQPEE